VTDDNPYGPYRDRIGRPYVDNSKWLNTTEAAMELGISVNALKKVDPGKLPYYVFNERGDRRYRRSSIEAFIEARMVTAAE